MLDRNKFYIYLIELIFHGCKVIDKTNIGSGHPDYIIKDGENNIYVELKFGEDGLRESQIKWFINNKDKCNKVVYIHSEIESFIPLSQEGYL